jgi:hypothetical protein
MTRKQIVRVAALLVLAICVWAHVSELFDDWDDSIQTRNGIEFNLVLVAVCIGTCIAIASGIAQSQSVRKLTTLADPRSHSILLELSVPFCANPPSSPPAQLKI